MHLRTGLKLEQGGQNFQILCFFWFLPVLFSGFTEGALVGAILVDHNVATTIINSMLIVRQTIK
jgi:hypothetical protein